MSSTAPPIDPPPSRAAARPLPANISGVQPGGGKCLAIELAWGIWRRWWLKTFRRGYVQRMAGLRRSPKNGSPIDPSAPLVQNGHEILDPRDLKFWRNVVDVDWESSNDSFRWREGIPFARWGARQLFLMATPLLATTIAIAVLAPGVFRWAAFVPGVLFGLISYFFRDPPRRVPTTPSTFVSPADGKLVEITELEHDEFIGGPAVRLGIFLSIFNVHINRAATDARVIELRYSPGEFLNALKPESAIRNENMWIAFEEDAPPYRRYIVRQISGAIARRIVCDLRPGEVIPRGHKFGMIKLGSRTELILPLADGLQILARLGDRVRAGTTELARYPG